MTGGAKGLCNPASAGYSPSYGNGRGMAYGRGSKGGFGSGWGMRRGFGAGKISQPTDLHAYPLNEANELNMLKAQASDTKGAFDGNKNNIDAKIKHNLDFITCLNRTHSSAGATF